MRSIILKTSVEQEIRNTIFTALMNLQEAGLQKAKAEVKDKVKNLQMKTLENYLQSNASKLAAVLSTNSFLSPRVVIGETFLFQLPNSN